MYKKNHPHPVPFLSDALMGALFTYLIDFSRTQVGYPDLSASETLILWLFIGTLFHLGSLMIPALIERILFRQPPTNTTAVSEMLVEVMPLAEIDNEFNHEEDDDPFWSMLEVDDE